MLFRSINDQSAAFPKSYEEFEAEFGLPEGLDLNAPPEVAFPPPEPETVSMGAPPLSPSFVDRVGSFGVGFVPNDLKPFVRDYAAEAEVALTEYTPQDMELNEILKTHGFKAFERRAQEHRRDADRRKVRKLYRANYERYAAEAKLKNIQRAAEKLVAEKLAAEKAAAEKAAAQTPQPEVLGTKKPPIPAAKYSSTAPTEVKKTA